jgi:hypothetical protein
MHRSYLEDFFHRMNDKVFFVLIIFVQVIFIFQGLDFADSGFDAEFYSRIFSDPSSVQYNFMYWFTGIIGGIWLKLFPGLGLLGLRMAGVLFTTVTFWITYDLLKKYLHTGPLRLSLFLIVLFLTTAIKEINYDDVTALFFISAAWFLFRGLTKQSALPLFVAGAFISLNTFSRLPNVLGLSLMLAIWFSGYLNRNTIRQIVFQSIIFLTGFIFMSIIMVFIMKGLHHEEIFLSSLKLARQIGGSHDNSHSLYAMFKQYILHYGAAVSIAIVVMVFLWSSAAAWRRLINDVPGSVRFLPIVKYIILIALTAICIYRAKKDPDFWFYLFLFYAGTSLIVGFLIVSGRQPKNLRILASIGCIMLLVMPVGSNFVLMTVGKYAVWIIVPITVDYLLNINALSSRVIVSENSQHSYEQVIDVRRMAGLRNATIYLTLIFILSVTYFYPYFDRSNRVTMHYTINNEHLHGIYTTEHRARVVNELLSQSAKYVKPDDYVLAYDCIPMYYYMTDTKPFMHNSWVWLYDDAVFKQELDKSLKETNTCPMVIMQKRSTIGNNWPDNYTENYQFRPEALAYMQDFLKTYQYKEVWENDFFKMYMPAEKTPAFAENLPHEPVMESAVQ